ncbi:MAG: flagellar motor switch protein FliG [Phycisphaerae bacterium]
MAAEDKKTLQGIKKAAILLLTVPEDTAAEILKRLDRNAVEEVTREIASLGQVPSELCNVVVEEFYNLALAQSYVEQGGLMLAKSLLEKSMPKEESRRILDQIEQSVNSTPFAFLQKAESENLLTFIQEEHPQTIALILSHLAADKAGEILGGLAQDKQMEVIMRIARMEQTNPEVIREVERGLEGRLSAIVSQTFEKAGGVEAVAEILNLADRATEKAILEKLETTDPELVEQIRRLMFVFEDINLVDDRGIQMVLKEIDNSDLSLALKTASEELKTKILRNMSERAQAMINEEMEYMGPVKLSDVEAAQQKIVDVVRRLDDAGEIVIMGRGGAGDIVV